MDRWSPVLVIAYLAMVFVCTTIAANPFFGFPLEKNRETSGSGQVEDAMLPTEKISREEALEALHIVPCWDGKGFACGDSGICFDSFEEICTGKNLCGMEDRCATEIDPEGCLENYTSSACRHESAIQWLTHYGAPNFPQLDNEFDLQAFFDLVLYGHTVFCPDGRIECNGDCIYYNDLCDQISGHCKCNGKFIKSIVYDKYTLQEFQKFMARFASRNDRLIHGTEEY